MPELIKCIKEIIDREYTNPALSIKTLSNRFNFSRRNRKMLGAKYREMYGCTITERINELRIGEAKRLINQSELPISWVSVFSGYSTRTHFWYMFKKSEGTSPGKYRAG